jgi:uncharacterized protein (TIGR00299 family) protein
MKTLYLDLFSGIAGDMFIGALIDLGLDPKRLERELKKLKLGGYHLQVSKGNKSGIAGTKFDVCLVSAHAHRPKKAGAPPSRPHSPGGHTHLLGHGRTFTDIRKLILASTLTPKIHGVPANTVHFHEVGAVDSIVDIVGGCIALELLGKPRVVASPVTEGVGWVDCAHGRMPVPAPATLAILGARGVGVTQCDEPCELVTPTGAAIVAEFAESFGAMANLTAERIGFGLGTRDNKTRPNVLRAVLGNAECKLPEAALDWETDVVVVLETNLDDCTGEVLGHFLDRAMDAGALDVFHVPVVMKKNRPGVLLTLLCTETNADQFMEMILRETTAFGVRRRLSERRKLKRESRRVKTTFGTVVVKIGLLNGKIVQASPEYECCRDLARKAGRPIQQVYTAALRALKFRW